MADPFSIVASTITVVDICVRLGTFFVDVKNGSEAIDSELDRFIEEIQSVEAVCKFIRQSFEGDSSGDSNSSCKDNSATFDLWHETGNALHDCHRTLDDLDQLIQKMAGYDGSSRFDKVRRYFRMQRKDEQLQKLWQQLNRRHHVLEILLTAINITYTRKSQETSSYSFTELSSIVQDLGSRLETQIAALRKMIDTQAFFPSEDRTDRILQTAQSITQQASLNMHFMIPQTVSSTFTGRKAALERLKLAHAAPKTLEPPSKQKRFVIYGLGGSGKTQFCCKFAQDNRQDFWGVFYIDASSPESSNSSYAHIAERAAALDDKVQPDQRSIKYWLSSQKRPWLLIIDNVDERLASTPAESYFPESEIGLVLLTTRDQSLKVLGTLSPRFFEFSGLEQPESVDLLLKSANHPAPWKGHSVNLATDICKTLGFLPIAIVHAGKTILKELCTLETYLKFFRKSWNHVRESMRLGNSSPSKPNTSDWSDPVFSTFEINFQAVSTDAIELLKLFSFMHRQRFHLQILIRAALNPWLEKAKRDDDEERIPATRWRQAVPRLALRLYELILELGDHPVVPRILHVASGLQCEDIEIRLRKALAELRSMSLIDHVEADDSYSMHPLVHWWARERMTLAEQAVWCQSACNILAHAVLLPPLDVSESSRMFRRRMLPHIEHMREQDAIIQTKFRLRQMQRKRPWPVLQRALRPSDMLQLGKFALVYSESGEAMKASELWLVVDEFLSRARGLTDPTAIRVRLALSDSFWWLGEVEKAASLQFDLLEACLTTYGQENSHTLAVMDRLGTTLWQQSKFQKAKEYHLKALRGFKSVYATDHAETFRAMTNLGRDVGKLAEFDEAVRLHTEALEGFRRDRSRPSHDAEILEVMQNLAAAKYDRHRYGCPEANDLDAAYGLQTEVVVQRERSLGKEHPLTLWAHCDLARTRTELGALDEAEDSFRRRLPIAEHHLGSDHIGTLFAKATFGLVLILKDKLSEAQEILEEVIREHETKRKNHPDQLVALSNLIECYMRQGKQGEIPPLREKVIQGVRHNFGEGSAWEQYFLKCR